MYNVRALAQATYGDVVRRPVYLILLVTFAVAILGSKLLTLFSFYQEMNMVREMGMATLTFWGFVIIVISSGLIVTQELEDRTAVMLLAKPVLRSDFLLGKFLGLLASLVPGLVVLGGILFLTLLLMQLPHLPLTDKLVADNLREKGEGAFRTTLSVLWSSFVLKQGGVVLEGVLLALLQCSILSALAISFSAFFPTAVSVAATTLFFILGNVSSYMLASVEKMDVRPLSLGGRAFAYVLPNLGYFNLQTYFSEGRIISFRYLALSILYASLLVGAIFLVTCSLFQKREVR